MSAVNMADVRDFYDEFVRKLLTDYAHGNPRIEAAIEHVVRSLSPKTRAVLDVGCGIGWTSSEIKRHLPDVKVVGVDLSGENIETARRLFGPDGIDFEVADATDPKWAPEASFDAVVMVDVYEHIPDPSRDAFDSALGRLLRDPGAVILTFPSEGHQHHLAENHPGGLQPVDEIITPATLESLGGKFGGSVESFAAVSIWRPGDYIHAVVRSGPKPVANDKAPQGIESSTARRSRISERMGLKITPDGYLLPRGSGPATLIVAPTRSAYSESFIRNHIERLPGPVEILFGGSGAFETGEGAPLIPRPARFLGKAGRKLTRSDAPWRVVERRALRRYCADLRVSKVLAEYGTTAATMSCLLEGTGVPVVAHFHGHEAYRTDVVDEWGPAYRRLFDREAAIIVVSEDMRRRLVDLGAREERLHVIRCGVDTALFAGAEPAANPPLFVAVGRFVDKKAPHLTLLAFERAHARAPEARLVMVGDGGLLEAARQMVQALGLTDVVDLANPMPQHAIAQLMRGARGYVQHSVETSLGDREGTPVAVMEAMSTGLPIIATRHTGIAEVVIDGETGLLCDEFDIEAMAGHIVELAQKPDRASQLGAAGATAARANHSLDRRIAQLSTVLDSVAAK